MPNSQDTRESVAPTSNNATQSTIVPGFGASAAAFRTSFSSTSESIPPDVDRLLGTLAQREEDLRSVRAESAARADLARSAMAGRAGTASLVPTMDVAPDGAAGTTAETFRTSFSSTSEPIPPDVDCLLGTLAKREPYLRSACAESAARADLARSATAGTARLVEITSEHSSTAREQRRKFKLQDDQNHSMIVYERDLRRHGLDKQSSSSRARSYRY